MKTALSLYIARQIAQALQGDVISMSTEEVMECEADTIGGRPQFYHNCEHCMGCVHHCPVSAINWKEKTNHRERYRNPNISGHELEQFVGHPPSPANYRNL